MTPTRVTWTVSSFLLATVLAWTTVAGVLHAAPGEPATDAAEPSGEQAETSLRMGAALPNTLAAAWDPDRRAIAVAMGGYDAAVRAAVARLVGDVHVIGPLDLHLGVTYLAGVGGGASQFQPQFGLRVRVLSTEHQGIDLALALLYRQERYASDDGMIQAAIALGRRWDRFALLANLAYGQDPEGDDRDGDVSLAVLYDLALPLELGLESHLRFDIDSDDPRRHMRGQGPFDLQTGPLLHYALGPAILTAQAGLSASRFERTRTGVFALAGLGGVY